MSRESFERQKLRSYRLTLAEVGETVTVAEASAPTTWRTIIASLTPEQRRDGNERTIDLPERIEVFCLRLEDDPDYSGIDQLVFGMLLKRAAVDDPQPTKPFVFRGEFLEQGLHYYRAIFERPKRISQGR